MMLFKNKLGGFLLQLVAVFAVYFALQAFNTRGTVSGVAPALDGVLLNGQPISLAALKGQPVLVHFWATWCSICKIEHGTIESVAKDVPVIAVATQSGTTDDVMDYIREHNLRFPVLVDEQGRLAKQFGVRAFPTTFIIDAQGVIRNVEVGYTSELGLRSRLTWVKWTG
jgi:peroxiredoxin